MGTSGYLCVNFIAALFAAVPEAARGVPADVVGKLLMGLLQQFRRCREHSTCCCRADELSEICLRELLLLPAVQELPVAMVKEIRELDMIDCCRKLVTQHLDAAW